MAEADEESRKLSERLLRFERESRFLRKDSDQRKVFEEVFDRSTLLAVEELFSKGNLSDLYGVVNSGKEARVYYGKGADGSPVAVKIYLTSSAEFKRRLEYIAGDRRFGRLPPNSRQIVYLWVQKEFKNLQLADSAGIRVPKPLAFHKNILVMEFIGTPPQPAPTFATSEVEESDYEWTFATIKTLYNSADLVHADLSEYNVLKNGDEPVLFDMGSAVLSSHPQAKEFLQRDITNMVKFFRRRGLFSKDADYWFKEVTG
ncbi:MAG TPA: serine protein kinase RIO [Nitrososphaerales archaeon]|nr:serine protein kinase RIO [Nitrososphaerales archaeon]